MQLPWRRKKAVSQTQTQGNSGIHISNSGVSLQGSSVINWAVSSGTMSVGSFILEPDTTCPLCSNRVFSSSLLECSVCGNKVCSSCMLVLIDVGSSSYSGVWGTSSGVITFPGGTYVPQGSSSTIYVGVSNQVAAVAVTKQPFYLCKSCSDLLKLSLRIAAAKMPEEEKDVNGRSP